MNFICNVTTMRIINKLATTIDASTLEILNLFGIIHKIIFYLYGLCDDAISKLFESALFIGSAWAVGVFYGRNRFLYHLGFYWQDHMK